MSTFPLSFSAKAIPGSGRGQLLGTPTINLSTEGLPEMKHGIYACSVMLDDKSEMAVMHYGPRPVFDDPVPTCEVHLLDRLLKVAPPQLDVTVAGYIRDVADFPSVDALRYQIERDIDDARAMLGNA